MMNTNRLAIDPGLREIGYALFRDTRLTLAGVKVLEPGKTSKRASEAKHWLRFMLHTFEPMILILEKTNNQRHGTFADLHRLNQSFIRLARRSGIPIALYPAQAVRKGLAGSGWASKKVLAQAVASRIPALRAFVTQDRRWKERHFQNLFDAVGLGLYHDYRPAGAACAA